MEGVITRTYINVKDRDKERSSPSRWLTEKALDVWYGNKTMVDILFGGLSDAIERIAARPGKSFYLFCSTL